LLQPYLLPAEKHQARRRKKEKQVGSVSATTTAAKAATAVEEGGGGEEHGRGALGEDGEVVRVLLGPLAQLPRAVQQQVLDLMVQLPQVQVVVLRAVLLALQVQLQAVHVLLLSRLAAAAAAGRQSSRGISSRCYTRLTGVVIDCGVTED
jgi:hypothetical protein